MGQLILYNIWDLSHVNDPDASALNTDKMTLKVVHISIYYEDKTWNFLCPHITSVMIATGDIKGNYTRTRWPTIFSVIFLSTPKNLLQNMQELYIDHFF